MQRIAILALAFAGSALAGTEELREMIQSKLQLNIDNEELVQVSNEISMDASAIDCSQGQNLFCPMANVPDVTFSATEGTMTSNAASCCPAKFLQCQIQQNQQYCRGLGSYTISETQGQSQSVCPPTTPECQCQQTLSGEGFLRLRFCPETQPCCPRCECYGDPHCRAFSGQQTTWATCDARDSTCIQNPTTCAATTFGGQPCKWIAARPGNPAHCTKADAIANPVMNMYTKSYKKYFVPSDNNVYEFKLVLTLGYYGAITRIDLTDTGLSSQTYSWFLDPTTGACKGNSAYPFGSNGIATVNNLPSTITAEFICKSGNGRATTAGRIDILKLQDPWYVKPPPSGQSFGGFCATGVISEATGESLAGSCNTVDRQLTVFLGCNAKNPINSCKSTWCNTNYFKLDYSNLVASGTPVSTISQKRRQCVNYVTNSNPAQSKNFLATVCATSQAISNGVFPVDPTTCTSDEDCKACMDNIMDFPEEIAQILQGSPVAPSPTQVCPDLLRVGLVRKQLGQAQSGITIDFQAPSTNTWQPVFALFNEEIEQCGCQSILVNGTEADNRVLFNPGKYRIRQCNGLDTDPDQEMCTSVPSYNTSVIYSNEFANPAISTPFGVLVTEKALVCNPTVYRGCPAGYSCCIWQTSKPGWEDCMVGAYGANYEKSWPQCKYPGK